MPKLGIAVHCSAPWATASSLAHDIDHTLWGWSRTGHAETRHCGAPWVAASLAHDIDHALPRMFGAELLCCLAADYAQARPCRTAVFVAAGSRSLSTLGERIC